MLSMFPKCSLHTPLTTFRRGELRCRLRLVVLFDEVLDEGFLLVCGVATLRCQVGGKDRFDGIHAFAY